MKTKIITLAFVLAFGGLAQAQTTYIVLEEDFEGLTLGPSPEEAPGTQGVWTDTPPPGWIVDDSGVPGVGDPATDGMADWAGWAFTDKEWWISEAADQRRSEFTLGVGTVAVADPDEWDDAAHAGGSYNAYFSTPAIGIFRSKGGSIQLKFDSSWRPEITQTANITVSYDGGDADEVLRWESEAGGAYFKDHFPNETIIIDLDNPPGAQSMVLTFGLFDAGNNWWWAIDNIMITGTPRLELAYDPKPANQESGVCTKVVLKWTPGAYAPPVNGHKVFFSQDFDDVKDGAAAADRGLTSDPEFDTAALPFTIDYETTYYWRIDEANTVTGWDEGPVWQFTTEPVAYPLGPANITATASSSEAGRGPENTVNESGLDGDLHSSDTSAMWLSTSGGPDPAWIQYEFDKMYKLYEMWVWNFNGEGLLTMHGPNEVTVEYSPDGDTWTELGGVGEFAKASGSNGYAHDTPVAFGGAAAKYVRITVNSNHSGGFSDQHGLSEVRFFYVPRAAELLSPTDGEKQVAQNVTLVWQKPFTADITTHKVYISTDEQAVIDRTVDPCSVPAVEGLCDTQASYSPSLEYYKTYYWRVDEYYASEDPSVGKSNQVWSFKVTYNPALIVDPNLIGWWKLDGDANDSSGYGNDGTANGVPTYVVGKVGQAMSFDGIDDYVAIDGVADDITSNDITLAAWVNMTADDDWYPVISCNTASGGNVGWLAVDDGYADFGDLTGTMFVADNDWHHLAYTRIGDTGSLYVDGVLEGTHTPSFNFSTSNLWSIGQEWDGGPSTSDFLIGMVDDVRLYTKALSPTEVMDLYRVDLAQAWNENPKNNATGVARNAVLSWTPGDYAPPTSGHYVYFGEDDPSNLALVASQPQNPNNYSPGTLDLGRTYYWAVDEANTAAPGGVDAGNIWSFTTIDHLVVDDMESYDGSTERIFYTWIDGIGDLECAGGNGTGSWVDLDQSIFLGGVKAMKYIYDNDGTITLPCDPNPQETRAYYSLAKANVADLASGIGSDWRAAGAKALSLQFYGTTTNVIESMWIELTDGAGGNATVTYGDYADENPADINEASWHEWNIDLQDFADGGVDLTNVSSIAIGIGSATATTPGGSGTVFFDDIRLYGTRCLLAKRDPNFAKVDYVEDCEVNYKELDIMFSNWLATASDPGTGNLVGWWKFDGNADDSSGSGIHGTAWGNPQYVSGQINSAMQFDGNTHVVLGTAANLNFGDTTDFSVALWVNTTGWQDDAAFISNKDWNSGGNTGWVIAGQGGGSGSWQWNYSGETGGRQDYDPSGPVLSDGEWHHLCVVHDRDAYANFYFDGEYQAQRDISGSTGTIDATYPTVIGTDGAEGLVWPYWFEGAIDDVRIYNTVLTDEQVLYLGLRGDLNEDDKVDFKDFAVLGELWLVEFVWP